MDTDRLIDKLADGPAAVPRTALLWTLARGLVGGMFVSFLIMLVWFGLRTDLANAALTPAYWMKFVYTLAFAFFAFWAAERLSRPGVRARWQAGLGILPLAAIGLAALAEWIAAAEEQQAALLMGESSSLCPWRILALATPVFAGAMWSMRKLAPTHPTLAGAAAGLAAGAAGAWIYAFACNETSTVFVAVWYTAGIALMGLLGASVGRWALRW